MGRDSVTPRQEYCGYCGQEMRASISTPRTTIFECTACTHRVAKPTVVPPREQLAALARWLSKI
jgi:ribosomal protein L37AE/L43A